MLIYVVLVILIFVMSRLQAINLNTESIVSENKILQTTLSLLHDYTDETTRFGFCLCFIIGYVVSEAIHFFLKRREAKAD